MDTVCVRVDCRLWMWMLDTYCSVAAVRAPGQSAHSTAVPDTGVQADPTKQKTQQLGEKEAEDIHQTLHVPSTGTCVVREWVSRVRRHDNPARDVITSAAATRTRH